MFRCTPIRGAASDASSTETTWSSTVTPPTHHRRWASRRGDITPGLHFFRHHCLHIRTIRREGAVQDATHFLRGLCFHTKERVARSRPRRRASTRTALAHSLRRVSRCARPILKEVMSDEGTFVTVVTHVKNARRVCDAVGAVSREAFKPDHGEFQ